MHRTTTLRLAPAWIALAAWLGLPGSTVAAPPARGIVVILADDLTDHEMRFMPRTSEHMARWGMRFDNATISNAMCCPSRATILTGRYTQNTGVYTNDMSGAPGGGFEQFYRSGMEDRTVATWLRAANWSTGFFGKYLNGYPGNRQVVPLRHVPVGWSHWVAFSNRILYFNYVLNEDGKLVTYGNAEADYSTDVLSRKAGAFLGDMLTQGRPFLLFMSPKTPHGDGSNKRENPESAPVPAPRHADGFKGLNAPRSSAFNRCSTTPSGEPNQLCATRALSSADVAWIDHVFRHRVQSLQAMDEMVDALLSQLAKAGVLQSTYVIFTSDNGFSFGEHWFREGKGRLYETESRVPLYISGPGVEGGKRTSRLVVNTDFAPTIAEMAGLAPPPDVDGRSLVPLLSTDSSSVTPWRKVILKRAAETANLNAGIGLKGERFAYNERITSTGIRSKELYDLVSDPDEANNIASLLTDRSANALSAALAELAACAGAACRTLEDRSTDALVEFRQESLTGPRRLPARNPAH